MVVMMIMMMMVMLVVLFVCCVLCLFVLRRNFIFDFRYIVIFRSFRLI